MSKKKGRSTFGYTLRRYNLTFGYAIFYSLILTALTVALSRVFASTSISFGIVVPEFLYTTPLGILYIYNILALAAYLFVTIVFPRYLQLHELDSNMWYIDSKLGIATSSLALHRMLAAMVGMLRIYLLGFVLTTGVSLLLTGGAGLDVMALLLTLAVGVLSVLLTMSPLFLLASLTKGRLILTIGALVLSGALGFLLYHNGYFAPESYEAVSTATRRLVSLSPLGLLLLGVALSAVCIPIAVSVCNRRASVYNIEELDADVLIALGVRPDLLILEKGRRGYEVAISGPSVNETDLDIPVPPLMEEDPEQN